MKNQQLNSYVKIEKNKSFDSNCFVFLILVAEIGE